MGMLPELEIQYPEGSDITIMNTYYSYPKFEDGKKVEDDYIIIVYKDNKTGVKKYKIINNPTYTYYKIKEGTSYPPYSQMFIEREKVEPVNVPFTRLEQSIAEETGNVEFYKNNIRNRNKAGNSILHNDPRIFFSDSNIKDHYRFKFANTYKNDIRKLYKGFFDIEVDGKWAKGDFVQPGECAINCVSFYDEGTDTVYTFILRDNRNPLIEKLENELTSGEFGFEDIRNFVIDTVGGMEKAEKYKLLDTKYEVYFFDYEIELIQSLFQTMHRCSPDFIEGWNSSAFDLEYIIARIQVLGYDPAEIMCDERWPVKVVKNFVDIQHKNELAERGDYTFISGLPIFIDQEIQYASRRKAKIGSYKSFKLDDIGLKEAGVRKLDYHHITNSILELPWLDFKTFFLYNIMDVIVQKCIETKTNDLEYIFSKCVVNNTSYEKGHRQTVYLINRMAADWYKMGYIIGNNTNRGNPKPPKYLGALVGEPTNTNSYSKIIVDNRPIWVCDNLVDYDFKSLYPSLMGEYNIAPNTQIGRINILEKVYAGENAYHIEEIKYSRGGEYIENLVTDNHLEFCHRWLHLANFQEMIEDINEFFGKYGYSVTYTNTYQTWQRNIIPTTSPQRDPLVFQPNKSHIALRFYNERRLDMNYNDLLSRKERYS